MATDELGDALQGRSGSLVALLLSFLINGRREKKKKNNKLQ
jgi:hypothetical protein